MFFITSFNKKLYNEYAHQFIDTYIKTKQTIKVKCYVESDEVFINHPNFKFINIYSAMPQTKEFLDRSKDRPPAESFMVDARRFCFKVFAQYHASKQKEKFMWLDADNIFNKQIPTDWFNKFIPDNVFCSYYGRKRYSELGVLGFNCKDEDSDKFFDVYLKHYTEDRIWNMQYKTDCHAFDNTINMIRPKEIRRGNGDQSHVIAIDSFINPYLDHKKGKRKAMAHSPEWEIHR